MEIENKPFVTIGVPVYNGGKFIISALESIKNQVYTNFDCHVVNNASTDQTEELVAEFVKNDSRFKLHNYKEFVGIAGSWNRTVQHISDKAKYFKVVQADDVIFPDSLESHVLLMEKYPDAGIASSFRMVDKSLEGHGLDYFKGNYRDGKEMLLKNLKKEAYITGTNTQHLYRVEHLKKLFCYPEIFIPEDLHMDTRLAYELLNISDLAFSFKIMSLSRRHSEAGTVVIARKLNTLIHSEEVRLNRFREFFPELNKDYAIIRRKYAFYLFMNYLMLNKKCIQWHKKNLKRKIKFSEYLAGIFWENIFVRKITHIRKKYFN